MSDPLLSRCVIAFIGTVGRLNRRSADARVVEAEGEAGRELLPRVRDIVRDVFSAEPLWHAASVSEMSLNVEAYLKAHQPELSGEAVEAICNRFIQWT